MNVTDFSYLLQKPEQITQQHVDSLKKIIEEFPYFQAARAVYLKALKAQESFKYNSELKHTAAYTTDRSILFEYITSEAFEQHAIAKKIALQTTNETLYGIDVTAEEVIVKDNKTSFDFNEVNSNAVMDPELFLPKEENLTEETLSEEKSTLQLGKPLDFSKRETHSFMEWMQLSATAKPIKREEKKHIALEKPVEEQEDKKEKKSGIEGKLKLIDKFLENNPKIPPAANTANKVNLAKENNAEKTELMTETLARVYLEQKKYKKAIQAYKILSLKYPEKSGFFADQINAVKKLKDNN
ncbi:hypothetical protein JoomaDRAFT_1747 [Galbibacter orientalis DSM 19592]|uniref:Tetratricopeptide repeat protein n=1 Tax=Galbibacter orientalis DSM 19592 TaxID=926559 RepID=I3C561_9FLAO|nr:hypothetical protein [Galbibacter orientalis]EIJ38754.1 hypothetical protein JoomaDRAFT_1747 [Galbibacter orientalis DSM 19592]